MKWLWIFKLQTATAEQKRSATVKDYIDSTINHFLVQLYQHLVRYSPLVNKLFFNQLNSQKYHSKIYTANRVGENFPDTFQWKDMFEKYQCKQQSFSGQQWSGISRSSLETDVRKTHAVLNTTYTCTQVGQSKRKSLFDFDPSLSHFPPSILEENRKASLFAFFTLLTLNTKMLS